MRRARQIFAPLAYAAYEQRSSLLLHGLICKMDGQSPPVIPSDLRSTFRNLADLLPQSLPKPVDPTVLLLPLPDGDEDVEGEFMEIDYQVAGEWFQVMGRITRQEDDFFLRVSSEDYQAARRRAPDILYSLYYLQKLKFSDRHIHLLLDSYPPSVLFSALRYTYSKRNHVVPKHYFLGMLKQWRLRQETGTEDAPEPARAEPNMSIPQAMNHAASSAYAAYTV